MSDELKNHGDGPQETQPGPLGKPMDRRQFLKAAGLAGAAIGVGSAFGGLASETASAKPRRHEDRPTDVSGDCLAVLGLGAGPIFSRDRNNTGFALFHNENVYLIDSGAGTPNEFMKLGVMFGKVKGLFFTHLHIDHTAGCADVLSRGFQANGPADNLKVLDIYGPSLPMVGSASGIDGLAKGIKSSFESGYILHNWQNRVPVPMPVVTTHPIDPAAGPGAVTVRDDADVLVEALMVDHDEAVGTCYAYRFTLRDGNSQSTGKVIVFSGDRAHYNARRDYPGSAYYAAGGPGYGKPIYFTDGYTNEDFQAAFDSFAGGATVLVHEVGMRDWANRIADPTANPFTNALYWHLVNSHADVSEVPVIAKDAGVHKLVLHHYGNIGAEYSLREARDIIRTEVLKADRKVHYGGKIVAPLEGDVIRF